MRLTEKQIEELEKMGARRWQKSNMDRMYINAKLFLELSYYGTGNISSAKWDGSTISNCQARRLMGSKTYIDVADGSIHSDNSWMEEKAEELLEKASKGIDKAAIMKRAWEIKRENKDNIFGLCLKMAWAEAKGLALAA